MKDILRIRGACGDGPRVSVDRRSVPDDEDLEGISIAQRGTGEKPRVVFPAQAFFIGHVESPRRVYRGQLPIAPVRRGTAPR